MAFRLRSSLIPLWPCFALIAGSAMAAQPAATAPKAPASFQKYCFECHGAQDPEGGIDLEKLLAAKSIGPHSDAWEKVIDMIETGDMPPSDAKHIPNAAERTEAIAWVKSALKTYADAHAGDPGRVTVRRLTSGEYAYAIRDLTGVSIKVGIDASSDSVGGEGFTNFGDVQFVQDSSIERYLEAAKLVADHAVIGAGPLEFYTDTGRTGLELSALSRINELYASKGFRVVSGEGGRPFGLERYGKAFYVAWYYKNRAALGEPNADLRDLAAREGITGRFADHVWAVVNRNDLGYPSGEMIARWKAIPAPAGDVAAAIKTARAGTEDLSKHLTTWPSWFFGRGDVAAGGAGDESPLVFDDTSLKVTPTHRYTFALGAAGRGGRGGRGAAPTPAAAPGAPMKVYLSFDNLNPSPGVKPVVIWRNPRVVVRAAAGAGGAGRGGRGGQNAAANAAAGAVAAAAAPANASGDNINANNNAAPAVIAANAVSETLLSEPATNNNAGRGGRGGGGGGAIISDLPLREVLSPEMALALGFGTSPDGTRLGENDFAASGPISFEIPAPGAGLAATFQSDVELGADRNGIVRVVITDRLDGPPARGAQARVYIGDDTSAGYKQFRAGIDQYVSLLPPNSHGEANPADKDPVPAPFDNTYNSPEHDAFVLKVKYQRTDKFFTDNMVDGAERDRLNQAWNDLFGSWPYHDAYLGMLVEHYDLKLKSPRIQDLDAAQIAALPEAARSYVAPLRAHYDEVMKAMTAAEPGHLENVADFASRAWRRPVTVDEKTKLRAFYEKSRKDHGLDHDDAVRAVIARVLVSPAFLYRFETIAAAPADTVTVNTVPAAERPLNGWEMASRLSFFLWSSIPDDELRRAAAAGELSNPDLLAKQVRRMTADPKARRIATEFFGQWLGFYHFDQYTGVDSGRFPEFTEDVRAAMYDEAVSTFEYIVRQDRPLKEVINADYTFLNEPLAKFYGLTVPVQSKEGVELVSGANAFNRGGALRLGSVLTTTSAPLRTSPVKRGDWLLRRVLGTPTPPPPPDAGSLPSDPNSFGGQTLRQRLDEHKRNPTCANCHLRIDPLGFPLEAFDAVGRVRDKYQDGTAVDVTGEFADKTTISGADGLLNYLASKEPQVMKTLSKKIVGYALGRTILASDLPLIDDMTAAGGNATFADLAVKVVTSRQFRNHQGEDADTRSSQ